MDSESESSSSSTSISTVTVPTPASLGKGAVMALHITAVVGEDHLHITARSMGGGALWVS